MLYTHEEMKNYADAIGIPTFTSKEGVWMYQDHDYELTLDVNNTTSKDQEMMASMAIFYYDEGMEEKIKSFKPISQ